MSAGSVRSIRDLIVMVQFDDDLPEIGELLVVKNQRQTTLLVDHLDEVFTWQNYNLSERVVNYIQGRHKSSRSVPK